MKSILLNYNIKPVLSKFWAIALSLCVCASGLGCAPRQPALTPTPSGSPSPAAIAPDSQTSSDGADSDPADIASGADMTNAAEVTDVSVRGEPGNYSLSTTIRSPDTGCDQYADWWEVLSEDGTLLYRRILLHSHVNEQPFTRSGGPIALQPDQVIVVRAHMHPHGYGLQAQRGTVADGFTSVTLPVNFAADVEDQEPQPSGCDF
ncbi:MAG TPA: hypothetical protein ACFE0H_11695 [Elainellaceae cyanobacterium]|jgi:hypothetical protein